MRPRATNIACRAQHTPSSRTESPEPAPQLEPFAVWFGAPGGGVPLLVAIDIRKVSLSVPSALVAEMVTSVMADVVGVPVISPLPASTDSPLGKPTAP